MLLILIVLRSDTAHVYLTGGKAFINKHPVSDLYTITAVTGQTDHNQHHGTFVDCTTNSE